MPPLFIPPLVKLALGVLGAGAVIHWVVKEVRRINAELERVRTATGDRSRGRKALPTLRRDPEQRRLAREVRLLVGLRRARRLGAKHRLQQQNMAEGRDCDEGDDERGHERLNDHGTLQ